LVKKVYMLKKIYTYWYVFLKMGPIYFLFRSSYEFLKRTGLLVFRFPITYPNLNIIPYKIWKEKWRYTFFYSGSSAIDFIPKFIEKDEIIFAKLLDDEIEYFNSNQYYKVDNWNRNPLSNNIYELKHWTKINFFDEKMGDIKFVWEKSKFSFIYHFIRKDLAKGTNNSKIVYEKIFNWIDENPINKGPQYACSQEISIRLLNWTSTLFFYSDIIELSNEQFNKLLASIVAQTKHVESNINFSRITVKNNHSISETLCIYLMGLIFPFLPESKSWVKKGKKMFEQEVLAQTLEDGTDNQYSINYLKVKLQLYTWAVYLSKKNNIELNNEVLKKINQAALFLNDFINPKGGVPNYGANDGSLYFKLNSCSFFDLRPQLLPLLHYFNNNPNFDLDEDIFDDLFWYEGKYVKSKLEKSNNNDNQILDYYISGYYGFRSFNSLLFIRMGNHKFRPWQSDNGHIDLWFNNINFLRDSGTFKYLTNNDDIKYFNGISGHNTVSVSGEEQMEKGPGFIWLNWTKGKKDYSYVENGVFHFRGIFTYKGCLGWTEIQRTIDYDFTNQQITVSDAVQNIDNVDLIQFWHPNPDYFSQIAFYPQNKSKLFEEKGYNSLLYGIKNEAPVIKVVGKSPLKTIIKINI